MLILSEIFSTSCMASLDSYKDVCFAIMSFRFFSGRAEKEDNKEETKQEIVHTVPINLLMESHTQVCNNGTTSKAYIREIGFKFTAKLQKVEEEYNQEYSKIKVNIQDSVNKYITGNEIKLNIQEVFLNLIY